MSLVHLRQEKYDKDSLQSTLERGFEAWGGLKKLLGSRQTLLLKPNFLVAAPADSLIVTHPSLILALVDLLLDHGYRPALGESPAFGSVEQAVAKLGLAQPLAERGVKYFSFQTQRAYQAQSTWSPYLLQAQEPSQYDGLINLPKFKAHCQFVLTGATKNLFGLVVGKQKALHHLFSHNNLKGFTRMILENAEQAKPLFQVMDGVQAMHRHGPRGGAPYPLHQILLGDDPLEMDWQMALLVGHDPARLPLFQVALPQTPHLLLAEAPQLPFPFELPRQIPIGFGPVQVLRSLVRHLKLLRQA